MAAALKRLQTRLQRIMPYIANQKVSMTIAPAGSGYPEHVMSVRFCQGLYGLRRLRRQLRGISHS